jgi:hypothetical protein
MSAGRAIAPITAAIAHATTTSTSANPRTFDVIDSLEQTVP